MIRLTYDQSYECSSQEKLETLLLSSLEAASQTPHPLRIILALSEVSTALNRTLVSLLVIRQLSEVYDRFTSCYSVESYEKQEAMKGVSADHRSKDHCSLFPKSRVSVSVFNCLRLIMER